MSLLILKPKYLYLFLNCMFDILLLSILALEYALLLNQQHEDVFKTFEFNKLYTKEDLK